MPLAFCRRRPWFFVAAVDSVLRPAAVGRMRLRALTPILATPKALTHPIRSPHHNQYRRAQQRKDREQQPAARLRGVRAE